MDDLKSLLEDLRELAGKNKTVVIAAAAAVALVIIVLGGISALRSSRGKAEGPAATTEAATTDATTGEVDVPMATPTEEQSRLISSYGADEQDLIGTLSSLPWVSPRGAKVSFSTSSYVDTDNEAHAYAISAVSKPETTTETARDNVVTSVTISKSTFAVLDDEGKTTICDLNVITDNNGTTRTITGSPFASGETLTAMESARELSMDVPQQLSDALGGKGDELVSALRRWATANVPAASRAKWDSTSTADYSAGTVSFDLALNDMSSTRVKVTYDTAKGTFDFKQAKEQ